MSEFPKNYTSAAAFTLMKYNRLICSFQFCLLRNKLLRLLRKRTALQSLIFDASTLSHLSLVIKHFYGNNSVLQQNTFTKNYFECIYHTFPLQMLNPYFILQIITIELKVQKQSSRGVM